MSYYTRIEQGETHDLSDSVLDGITGALRLDQAERDHLARIARPGVAAAEARDEEVRGSLRAVIESNTSQAVVLLGRRTDVLAANQLGRALLGLGGQTNMARLIFLRPAARGLFVHWESEAHRAAAALRLAASAETHDPLLAALIGELSMRSKAFVRIWATYPVTECLPAIQEYNTPTSATSP